MSPILPENQGRYPSDWAEVRERIRARATGPDGVRRCEGCGVRDGAVGFRRESGDFVELAASRDEVGCRGAVARLDGLSVIEVVCTVAHFPDHDPANCADENLHLWCQQCHNRADAPHRAATRARRRDERNGQVMLL